MDEQKYDGDSSATSCQFSKHVCSIFALREVINLPRKLMIPINDSKASEFHFLTTDGASFLLEFFTSYLLIFRVSLKV